MSTRNRAQLCVAVQIATSRRGVPHARSLRAWVATALQNSDYSLQPAAYSLTLRIVGSAESRKLNRHWRGKDKPTNVLSFPALTNHESRITNHAVLGDLAICASVVAREAREQGKTLSAHWAHMVVHGVLHLQGYDHVTARDARRMEAHEVDILRRFGFVDPYR